ncbi:hypothetical protein D6T64_05875 [Cryobacterium melibiosiphilum]|uniref:Uncharacterized protein n=1 Tax=Cryobacterium melibiosiphilum TaxID=995039 RepID=A0A3A5MRF3_9MICO|nr:hypothetical protein [Cryobacterium melibiosiphilum]RJT89748.1 hypothetical protein D6T64_05875 [Cryobacterium melibiosiphilum]
MTSAPDDPRLGRRETTPTDSQPAAYAATSATTVRQDVVAKEKSQFGGMQFGTAFFGWLTASGAAVLLTALVAGAGAAVGLGNQTDPTQAADAAADNAATVGLVGAIALAVVIFVSYFCGGYVAGRMARFSGAKQGVAVWLWAVIVAVILAIVGAIAGSQFTVLADLNTFPRIPINEGDLAAGSIITAIVIALVSLGGAVLGGLAGMRYHRKVDKAGLGA